MEPAAASPVAEVAEGAARKASARRVVLRTALGLLVAFLLVTAAGRYFRTELEALSRLFVEHLGFPGMALGTFLADAFTVPMPSWLFFVLAVASGASPLYSIAAVSVGSLVGGCVAYLMSVHVAESRLLAARIARARERLGPLLAKHGVWAVVLMGLVPVPFSVSCYVAGSYRIGPRLFGLYLLLRIPRLCVFYLLVRLGW